MKTFDGKLIAISPFVILARFAAGISLAHNAESGGKLNRALRGVHAKRPHGSRVEINRSDRIFHVARPVSAAAQRKVYKRDPAIREDFIKQYITRS